MNWLPLKWRRRAARWYNRNSGLLQAVGLLLAAAGYYLLIAWIWMPKD